MITEMVLDFLLTPITSLLSSLPISTIEFSDGIFTFFRNTSATLNYILPVNGLFTILTASIFFRSTNIIMALIVRVKSFIPTMGS